AFGWFWSVLHVSRELQPAPGYHFAVGYPLIPWIGVLAAGYGFGTLFLWEQPRRRRTIFRIGLTLIALFLIIRGLNIYGDLLPWSKQKTGLATVFAFIRCHKYPPSLDYLLMTLGPALVVLSLFDRGTPRLLRPLIVFGRVPLFFYLIHLPLIHTLAVIVAWVRFRDASGLFGSPFGPTPGPAAYGY